MGASPNPKAVLSVNEALRLPPKVFHHLFMSLAALVVIAGLFLYFVVSTTVFVHFRFHRFHRRHALAYPPLGAAGWAGFYVRAVTNAVRLWWWWVRARFADGLRVPGERRGQRPVLCVHGFHMDGTAMWGHRRTLEAEGRATRAVSLGLPYRSAGVYARKLARVLRELYARFPGEDVDVVAHSMGGVILRLVLAREPSLAPRIRRIVTLGSPHHGTAVLRWIRFGPVYRLMSRGSSFLDALPAFATVAPEAEVTTIASAHDLIVYPVETGHLPGARQVTLERVGHLDLLTKASIRRFVAELLEGENPVSARR